MSTQSPPIHFVVIHRSGPKWKYGVDFREQDGVREHVQHYLEFHKQGKLEPGGPFLLPDAGGMMAATSAVSEQELESFTAAEPAVKSGLLTFKVQPWLTAMARE